MNAVGSTDLYIMSTAYTRVSQLKKVEAEVRKERFPEVDFALKRIGVPGLTVAEEQRAGRGLWSYPMENVKHLILTVVVDDDGVRKVVESIRGSAHTGSWGDGRIAVSTIEDAFDIGSGRTDRNELTMPALSS
ncbi:MAG TPA: P-II family nitrogen regulator [Spirochaetia bacterium]|nr:P-II family nitrogen regulator [Spirochaetia bacterium]